MATKTTDPKTHVVDMSPEAIGQRLARLEELFQLGLSLRKAKKVEPKPAR